MINGAIYVLPDDYLKQLAEMLATKEVTKVAMQVVDESLRIYVEHIDFQTGNLCIEELKPGVPTITQDFVKAFNTVRVMKSDKP